MVLLLKHQIKRIMATRYAIYKNGYVHEDLSITDAKLIHRLAKTFDEAKALLMRYCSANDTDISDYHIQQEQNEYMGWVSIEGTEVHF